MFQTLDFFADWASPLFGIALFLAAIFLLRKDAPLFLLRCFFAAALSQQFAKFVQKSAILGAGFPSTHFAFALALATCFWVLKPKLWPLPLAFLLGYGALMLFQHYHTPVEMLGAVYAIPLSLGCLLVGRKRALSSRVAPN